MNSGKAYSSGPKVIKPLSDAVSEIVIKAYKAGGFALAILTLGAFLMLLAFFLRQPGPVRFIVLGVGVALEFFTLFYVYVKELRRLVSGQGPLGRNKDMLDAIQRIGLELTALVLDLQALAFKHADQVERAIASLRPFLQGLSLADKLGAPDAMIQAHNISKTIVDSATTISTVITELEQALAASDPTSLGRYLDELQQYRQAVKAMLKT
jgi:hypothetical protein